MGITEKVSSASKWSLATQLLSKLMGPITNMFLARLLAPEAFGMVATITMITSFSDIFTDAGFQKYLVQQEFCCDFYPFFRKRRYLRIQILRPSISDCGRTRAGIQKLYGRITVLAPGSLPPTRTLEVFPNLFAAVYEHAALGNSPLPDQTRWRAAVLRLPFSFLLHRSRTGKEKK